MSKTTQNSNAGTPVVPLTAPAQVTDAGKEWALTVALQKTEWQELRKSGVVTRLLTLTDPKSGRKFAAVFWACATEDLEADNERFTFLVSGTDVDDIVARLGERATEESK